MVSIAAKQPGGLDPDFNGGKVDLSHLGLSPVFMNQVRPTPDGGVLVTARGLRDERFISKFTRQGRLDQDFHEGGFFAIAAQQQLLVAADGGFYLVDKLSETKLFVEKFYANGQHDERYAEKGKAIIDFATAGVELLIDSRGPNAVPALGSTVLAALDGGALYVVSAGYWGGWDGYRTVLARLNEDGLLDTHFGKDGFVLFGRSSDKYNLPTTVQVQKIIGRPANLLLNVYEVMPSTEWGPGYYFHLYRITGAGGFDEAFGDQGVITVHQDQELNFDFIVDEQQTLKTIHQYTLDKLELKGWTVDGKHDESFDGWSIPMPSGIYIGSGLKSYGAGENYRVVHFGSLYGDASKKRDVFRHLANGCVDPVFGENGVVTLNVRYSGWYMNEELKVVPDTHDLFFTTVDDVYRLKGS